MFPTTRRFGLNAACTLAPRTFVRGLSTGPVTVSVKVREEELCAGYLAAIMKISNLSHEILLKGGFAFTVPPACLLAFPQVLVPPSVTLPLFFGLWALSAARPAMELLQVKAQLRLSALSNGAVSMSQTKNHFIRKIREGANPKFHLTSDGIIISGPLKEPNAPNQINPNTLAQIDRIRQVTLPPDLVRPSALDCASLQGKKPIEVLELLMRYRDWGYMGFLEPWARNLDSIDVRLTKRGDIVVSKPDPK